MCCSILGGIVYSLAGYVAYTDSPQMLHGAVWAPLVLLFLFRAEHDKSVWNAVLSGFFLGVTWLVGHHQMQIFLSLAVLAMWIWVREWRLGAIAVVMTALTSAFQTLPAAEYGRLAVRWVGADQPQGLGGTVPYPVHMQYAMKPISLIGIFVAGVEQGPYNAFVGVVAFTLAILGSVVWWRVRYVRWLAAIGMAAIVFALGGNSVFHGVLYALAPLVEKARVPQAATVIFAMAMAPLVAFGLDGLRESAGPAVTRNASRILAGFGALLAFAALFFYAAKIPIAITDDRMVITALCALLAAGLLTTKGLSRFGTIAAIGLVLFELSNVTDYSLATADRKTHPYLYTLADHYDLAAFVRGRGVPGRIVYDSKAIPYNVGDWYGLEALSTYAASVPASLWSQPVFSPRVQDVLGVLYYFGITPQRPDLQQVFEGRSGVKVFENLKAFPRAWAVHKSLSVSDWSKASAMLADPAFDARHEVFLIGEIPPKLATCEGDEVWMPRHHPNDVLIRATMACRGMVILSDSWFPGWTATVDGHAKRIEKAYGSFRGVVVEAGDHTIEMKYRPASVFLGGVLTLVSLGIASVAFVKKNP
jgi:hypothetical protein